LKFELFRAGHSFVAINKLRPDPGLRLSDLMQRLFGFGLTRLSQAVEVLTVL
jgi:hypothetical protein